MKIFGQGAMSYFLSRMSYFPYFMILTEGWRKLNISVRKSVAFLFPLLATFARTKKETNMTKKIGKLNVWLMLLVSCAMGITSCKTETKENTQKGYNYNPQIQISAESETKRSIFREKDKTKRSKKESAQHSKSRNKSFVMTSVSAL